jgi:hypothetical protein
MIETLDIRLRHDRVVEQFGDGIGEPLYVCGAAMWNELDEAGKKLLRPMTRKIVIRIDAPFFPELGRRILSDENGAADGDVASAVLIHRRYTTSELRNSELVQIKVHLGFKYSGEVTGTLYDDRETCPICGNGRVQVSPLRLDLSRGPTNADIARTLANEIVVSERLAQAIRDESISGVELAPVEHSGRKPAIRPGTS